jgi:hypothetical protein
MRGKTMSEGGRRSGAVADLRSLGERLLADGVVARGLGRTEDRVATTILGGDGRIGDVRALEDAVDLADERLDALTSKAKAINRVSTLFDDRAVAFT